MDVLDEKPDYQKAYKAWSGDRSPQATSQLLSQLEPIINRGISTYGSGKKDPLMTGRARRITVDALKTYDPRHGTRLTTHVQNHLQGLSRVARRQNQVLRVPDRVAMDQAYLHNSSLELEDKLGREPSIAELSDYTSLSPQKITRTRRYRPAMAEGTIDASGSEAQFANPYSPAGHSDRLANVLYEELDPRDQKIMEWSLGMFGGQQLSNQEIAAKLRVTPGAISQRKKIIQQKFDTLTAGGI